MHRLWTATLLLGLLLLDGGFCQEPEDQSFPCGLSRAELGLLVNETRTWNITNDALEEHSLQSIINCTREGDTLSLQTTRRIQPRSRIVIPWDLTIEAVTDQVENNGAANIKASITCPSNEGLFLLRSSGVRLTNLMIERCDFSEDNNVVAIIETGACPQQRSNTKVIHLRNVEFTRNRNLGGSVGLVVQDPSCYKVVMRQVLFQFNQYAKRSEFANSANLVNVHLERNALFREAANRQGQFYFPPGSNTTIRRMSAKDNRGGLLHVEIASIDIRDSFFMRNSAPIGGVVFANVSNVSVSSSLFHSNTCQQIGTAIFLNDGCSGTISSVQFISNSAATGGAILMMDPRDVEILSCIFVSNSARNAARFYNASGGAVAVYVDDPNSTKRVRISACLFHKNSAQIRGGAIWMHRFDNANITIKNSKFLENTASELYSGRGGAIALTTSTNCRVRIKKCDFEANKALDGGGVYVFNFAGRLRFQASNFSRNEAITGAGVEFLSFDANSLPVSLDDVIFDGNGGKEAFTGGALFAEGRTIQIRAIGCQFLRHSATDGAAIHVEIIEQLTVTRCTFAHNRVTRQGAALWISTVLSEVQIFQAAFLDNNAASGGGAIYIADINRPFSVSNSSFVQNKALAGGAIHVSKASSISIKENCTFEENQASLYGGAIYMAATDPRDHFELSNSSFSRNRAIDGIGGTLDAQSLQIDHSEFDPDETEKWNVRLKRVIFEHNQAERAGGGFFIDNIESLHPNYDGCDLDGVAPFSPDVGYFTSNVDCGRMENNSVGRNGYGPNVATATSSFYVTLVKDGKSQNAAAAGETLDIPDWRSGDLLPDVRVAVFDHFHQGPAVTKSNSSVDHAAPGERLVSYDVFAKATVESLLSDGLLPNPLITDVSRDSGDLVLGAPVQTPGAYLLSVWLGDDKSPNALLNITLRECTINEESTRGNTLCASCDSNHFNFHPEEACKTCPDNADCSSAFVLPDKGHWNAFPCSDSIKTCISEEACKGIHAADINEVLKHKPTDCNLSEELRAWYSTSLCAEGYTAALCGSCTDSFGRVTAFTCSECLRNGASVVMILVSVLVVLTLTLLQIKGNLDIARYLTNTTFVRQKFQKESGGTNGVNRSEMHSADPASTSNSVQRTSWYKQEESLAKAKFVELLKITINFLQTVAAGASLDVSWNDSIVQLLRTWDWIGGAVMESSGFTVDCLLPTDWSTPRSVIRHALMICLPVLVLFMISVYWTVRCIKLRKGSSYLTKRILLTALVVSYISYISLTKAAINVFYCVDVHDGTDLDSADLVHSYWAVDTAVRCYEGSHWRLVVYVAIPLLLFSLLFPTLLALTLIIARRSASLKSDWAGETVGLFFRGFEENFVFWDSVILLRKAFLAAIVVSAYSLGGNLQGILAVGLLMLSLFLQTRFNPFKSTFGNLNQLESMSLLISSFTFLSGIFLNDSNMNSSAVETVLVSLVFLCNVGMAVFLACLMVKVKGHQMRLGLLSQGVDCESNNDFSVLHTYFLLCFREATKKVRSFLDTDQTEKRSDYVGGDSEVELTTFA